MAFLAPSYTWRHKLVSTTVKRSVFTSTAGRYGRGTTEHPGLDAKVDVDAYCSLIIFFTSILISLATTGLPFF